MKAFMTISNLKDATNEDEISIIELENLDKIKRYSFDYDIESYLIPRLGFALEVPVEKIKKDNTSKLHRISSFKVPEKIAYLYPKVSGAILAEQGLCPDGFIRVYTTTQGEMFGEIPNDYLYYDARLNKLIKQKHPPVLIRIRQFNSIVIGKNENIHIGRITVDYTELPNISFHVQSKPFKKSDFSKIDEKFKDAVKYAQESLRLYKSFQFFDIPEILGIPATL